jgi:hypothetical protein
VSTTADKARAESPGQGCTIAKRNPWFFVFIWYFTNTPGLSGGWLRYLLKNCPNPSPFLGGKAGGERGICEREAASCVAANVNLPRASRGHPTRQNANHPYA